ncbi:hypothetical protein KKG24_04145 [Patescibacteria group bacterium]|nr:hypothetical protein [Patescibacteria group bacterium]
MDINNIINKIKNQSTLIAVILLFYSYFSLKNSDSYTSPLIISGGITFLVGIFLVIGNFFVNQLSEYYKYIIQEMKNVINTLKSQNKFSSERYKELLTNSSQSSKEITKGYSSEKDETQNEQ